MVILKNFIRGNFFFVEKKIIKKEIKYGKRIAAGFNKIIFLKFKIFNKFSKKSFKLIPP